MKIIHTADWHLGQRLLDNDRRTEHQHFLDWLLLQLSTEKPDALIVAGDIFDIGNPPNYALKQYYDFLREARKVCPHLIITGGNHDSIANLNAPEHLLKSFGIYVIGGAKQNLEDEIVEIKNADDELIGAVAAVPFLRERDVLAATAGESYTEREQRIKGGIKQHYHDITALLTEKYGNKIPLIATGHLFAAGKSIESSDVERDIHIGNRGRIGAEAFPKELDYVALGHIHQAQIINKQNRIRYCGSPIPLSFSERDYKHKVLLVEFDKGQLTNIKDLAVPLHRKLLRIKGSLEDVLQKLLTFDDTLHTETAWVEVIIELTKYETDLDQQIKEAAKDKNIRILRIRVDYPKRFKDLDQQLEAQPDLDDLSPQDVFTQKLESVGLTPNEEPDLVATYNDLLDWMQQELEHETVLAKIKK